jgi:hypothetical protein
MIENENLMFRKTLKQVVKDLETITACPLDNFQDTVIEKFERYSYEGEDEVIGFDTWSEIHIDGTYELEVSINHEHAYVFTLHTTVENKKVTVTNVL